MIEIPAAYRGREHTFLKHRVLREYLESWAHKLGSVSRKRSVRLWYVDCFAGPWKSQDERLQDTSIFIALEELARGAASWASKGYSLKTSAIFVEPDARAFEELWDFLASDSGAVDCHPLNCEFGDAVDQIRELLGKDAVFLFVDPTGWKGAAMRFIAPLTGERYRDVMVNVMFNDINRFKHHPGEHIRLQMRDFFGLDADELEGLSGEAELMDLYRTKFKERCGVSYAADLAIMHPTRERTKFRLVVGGNDPMVLNVFRRAERKVIGLEAAAIRANAKQSDEEERTGQQALFTPQHSSFDAAYSRENRESRESAAIQIESMLAHSAGLRYSELWPAILESNHLVEREVGEIVRKMELARKITVANRAQGERSIKDHHLLQHRSKS